MIIFKPVGEAREALKIRSIPMRTRALTLSP